jgi:hypothetical protein
MLTDMPDETETLLRRLISGDQAAVAAVLAGARSSEAPALLVAAALISGDSDGLLLLARATTHAATTRDRQLVAVAAADLKGDHDLFDALIRDHLADHPDNVLAAWIATRHTQRHTPFTH